MMTFAVVTMMLVSVGFAHQATARPAAARSGARAARPASSESQAQAKAMIEAATKNGLVSYAEPSPALVGHSVRRKLGPNASPAEIDAASNEYLASWRKTTYHGPDPVAYQRLMNNEQRALAANSSPAAMGLAVTGTLRLFAVAVEFNGTDTAPNFSHPVEVADDSECITETVTFTGPLHGQIPEPSARDNNTYRPPSFEPDYYQKLVFSTEGITERVRLDLRDPEDGQPGIDVSGQTMRNYYTEVSDGRVQFDGGPKGVVGWVQVPHSEGYYGASECVDGEPPRQQNMSGLPQNPRHGSGATQLLVDIVDAINAADPNFPWADYDTDGNGVIDHVVAFHAGKDKSDGGGIQGYQALWAHRGNVDPSVGGYTVDDRGTPDPSDDIKLAGYTMQYEDAGTGVLVHEFGHDLGLPDLYDTSGVAESSVVWWDLMSTGSHPGKLFDTHPTHMSAWSKFALGWADVPVVTPTVAKQNVVLGQTSNPPAGSKQAVRVNLPDSVVQYTELLTGSTQAWWTGNDQDWADVRLTRDVNLAGKTAPISVSFDLDSITEQDWDYLFLEVSTDGGATYTQTKGFEVGSNVELTTPDDYGDPNGRLGDYGGLRYGYTGDISALAENPKGYGGWVRAYHDLSAYAGQNIKLRFRLATDAAFVERGAFVDNIRIDAANGAVLNDPVEGSNTNGWTATVNSFTTDTPLGAGWRFSDGIENYPLYYLLEWRNLNGFDEGLKYTYNTVIAELTSDGRDDFVVDKVPSNVPGMLVWLRDTRYGNEPFGANNAILGGQFFDMPSEGPKGGLLVIDSHPQPLRGPRGGTITTGQGTFPFPPANNWSGRVQTTNSAFGLQSTPGITLTVATGTISTATTIYTPTFYAPLQSVSLFDDGLGYYPGVEQLTVPVVSIPNRARIYAYSDGDASAVVPAKGYYPPKTPAGFTGLTQGSDVSTFETILAGVGNTNVGATGGFDNLTGQHSGNPRDSGVQYGYRFQVISQGTGGSSGTIQVWIGLPVYLPVVRVNR
jgi:immune inhibitor A